jgi:osmoprotectant transport system ATP-binding protein
MINKLLPITDGEILIDGEDITCMNTIALRRNIGYAIQEVALFPHMTVAQNIATVPALKKWGANRINSRVDELLHLIGLDPAQYRSKYPLQLSGGERQRVGVARALGADPSILLMDEPFGAIDPITRKRLQDEFLMIQKKIHKTVVFVTHDIQEAIKMGNKIAILDRGNLIQYGTPKEILEQPANSFVEEFMGTDRNMKWLQLIFVEELLEMNDVFCLNTDSLESVHRKIKDTYLRSLPVLDNNHRLLGYIYQGALREASQDWVNRILPYDKHIDRKASVYDALFYIFVDRNNYLPITDENGRYLGVVTQKKLNSLLSSLDNNMEMVEND